MQIILQFNSKSSNHTDLYINSYGSNVCIDTGDVIVNDNPTASISGDQTICDDASYIINVNIDNATTGSYDIAYTGNPGNTLSGNKPFTITVPWNSKYY